MPDLEYKVDYSAPKRDLTLVEAPETIDSLERFLPVLYEYENLSKLVPWREGRKMFQDFVDRLPRPSINSADDDDHICPICKDKYDSAGSGAERDTAVKLKCGHVMGSYCLFKWMKGNLEQGCPFCRRAMMLQDAKIKETRADDLKRYLFWVMRTRGGNIGIEILNILEHHKISQLSDKSDFATSINHTREEAEIKKELETACLSSSSEWQKRLGMAPNINDQSGCRVYFTPNVWLCTCHVVDWIISDPGEEEEIERYVADKDYGPYGSRVDYSDLLE